MFRYWIVALLALVASLAAAPAQAQFPGADVSARPDPATVCHIGIYLFDDGSWLDVAPVVDKGLRWRRPDGSTSRMTLNTDGHWISTLGWTNRVEGPQPQLTTCEEGRVTFEGQSGMRAALDIVETTFEGHGGTRLAGRLILPPGDKPAPIMVEVHGSEGSSALDFNAFQRLAPVSGVGIFIYAKRGSGGSEGKYTQDFSILADDAAAAVREAQRLAGARAGRVGLHGGSQAGWVAPLAASKAAVDFVIVDSGLAFGPLAQERDQVAQDLQAKGWGPEIVAIGNEITDDVSAFVVSNGGTGFDGLDAVRDRYGDQPWFGDIGGDFTGMLLTTPNDQLTVMLPYFDVGTSWNYDPMPVLSGLDTPMLWILAKDDTQAPNAATRDRLIELSAQGRAITVLQYPDTDHGIFNFETDSDGRRTSLASAAGYYQAILDWAKSGKLDGAYGDGQVLADVK